MEIQLIATLGRSILKKILNINVPDVHEQVLNNITQNNDCGDLDRQISDDKIIASIKFIHSNRSSGPDEIYIEMIKSTINEILLFPNVFQ